VLSQQPDGLVLYWELPRAALARCSVDEADGRAALRVVGFSASGSNPGRVDKTLALGPAMLLMDDGELQIGRMTLPEFGPPVAVRAARGWESSDGFLPLTVGRFLEECGADHDTQDLADRAAQHLG
jgi:hypothetical protein